MDQIHTNKTINGKRSDFVWFIAGAVECEFFFVDREVSIAHSGVFKMDFAQIIE